MKRPSTFPFLALSLAALAACGDPSGPTDASGDTVDAVSLDVSVDSTSPIDAADTSTTDAIDTTSPTDVAMDTTTPTDVVDASNAETGTDVTTNDATCAPITNDTSAIGRDCSGSACPSGYTCQSMSGIVLQQRCEVICRSSCECPATYACNSHADKAGSWMQCDAP